MAQASRVVPTDMQELCERFEAWRRTRPEEIADSGATLGCGRATGPVARRLPDGAGAAIGVQKAQAVDGRGNGQHAGPTEDVLLVWQRLWNW